MSNDYNQEAEVEESADLSTQEDNNQSYEQDDSATEGESETSDESNVERQPETSEQRVARLKRQLEREERKLGIEGEKPRKQDAKKEDKGKDKEVDSVLMERLDRGDLRFEGVKDKGEQDIIIEYASWKNMDVLEAMNSAAVKAELKEYRAKSATPSPSKRTVQGTRDDVAYWADQMKKGNRAPTAELRTKARDYLAKNK